MSMVTPSEERVLGMTRTLHRRCTAADENHHAIKTLHLVYRKDVAMECQYADDLTALANATKLVLTPIVGNELLADADADAGAWSVQLLPATAELQVRPFWYAVPPATTELLVRPLWYAVRPPCIHDAGVHTLWSLTLLGETVVCAAAVFPSLEDLHVGECTLAGATSDTMPRLIHLRFTNVSVRTDGTRTAITVLADELAMLRMSWHRYNKTVSPSEPVRFLCPSRVTTMFTKYTLFRLRAPKLTVFEWRCCYAEEVRIESVGRLSDVAIEVAAGRTRTTTPYGIKPKYVTAQERDKLMTTFFKGLCLSCILLNKNRD